MAETVTALNDSLFSILQKETFVILGTVDAESGYPSSHAISWVYAKDPQTVRFAVDGKSRLVANVKANPKASVSLFATGTYHVIYGKARIVTDAMDQVPFPLACLDLDIVEVRDAMFYGAKVSVVPEYEKTYDKRAADKLDGQVFDAMKKA